MKRFLLLAFCYGVCAGGLLQAAEDDAARSKVSFFARRDYPGMYTQWVEAADTNGDGIPDMIALYEGNSDVLLGNGDGTFGRAVISTFLYFEGTSFAAADLNGDNTVDLVIAGTEVDGPNGIAISLGNGNGTFQPKTFYAINDDGIAYIALGDFNNDGYTDIAASGATGIWLLTGRGDGTFNTPVLASALTNTSGVEIATADFNSDGNLDLAVPTPGSGFVVLFGNGNGSFQSPLAFSHPSSSYTIAAGVLVKGGFPGVVLQGPGSSPNDVYLYLGNGIGEFKGPQIVTLTDSFARNNLAIADVNGDGYPDLISGNVEIAFGTASGKFRAPVDYAVNNVSPTFNLALADLRNDGRLDILTDSQDSVSVLLNTGLGGYEDGLPVKITGGTGCGASADFNGDGLPDLAVNDLDPSGITVLLGTGKATSPFTRGETIAGSGIGCLLTADVNGDGIPDIVAPADSNSVVTYLGNGDGTFTLKSTTPTPSGGYVALGDFNHDGKLDFVTSGNLLALGNGDGTFQTPVPYIPNPLSGGFSNLAVGDINNDGWPDVVLTNTAYPTQNMYVLLNNQQGGFTSIPTGFGVSTNQAILTDLNGDGNLDLITSGAATSLYLGDGTGQFTYLTNLGNPAQAPGFDMVADLNGDGIPDIGVLAADTLAIFFGKGSATYSSAYCIGTGPAPTSLLPADLHGQGLGFSDIVSTDSSTGVIVLLNLTK
jgi:hypothetical protein